MANERKYLNMNENNFRLSWIENGELCQRPLDKNQRLMMTRQRKLLSDSVRKGRACAVFYDESQQRYFLDFEPDYLDHMGIIYRGNRVLYPVSVIGGDRKGFLLPKQYSVTPIKSLDAI